jgi:hypothetical protein
MPNPCDYGHTGVINGETLRLYTRAECENTLGGNFGGDGTCYENGTGKPFSYDCRNEPIPQSSAVSGLSSLLSGGSASPAPQWWWWAGGAGAAWLAWKTLMKK